MPISRAPTATGSGPGCCAFRIGGKSGPPRKADTVDQNRLRDFPEAGKLTPIIDRTFSPDEVPEAIRYLRSGQAQGRIVISI